MCVVGLQLLWMGKGVCGFFFGMMMMMMMIVICNFTLWVLLQLPSQCTARRRVVLLVGPEFPR